MCRPDVVDEEVERPVGEVDQLPRAGGRREVDLEHAHRSRGGEVVELLGRPQRAGDDLRALLDQCSHGRETDPPAGAGDDGDPALQPEIHADHLL